MSDVTYRFADGGFKLILDSDQDGTPSVTLDANLGEIVQEIISKGEEVEEKTVKIKMEGLKLVIELDSDKDGETSLKLMFDLPEGFDEGMAKLG